MTRAECREMVNDEFSGQVILNKYGLEEYCCMGAAGHTEFADFIDIDE